MGFSCQQPGSYEINQLVLMKQLKIETSDETWDFDTI